MKLSKKDILKFSGTIIFLSLVLFANFYAVRKMMNLGLEVYFYDKLSVAYDIGKRLGMEEELRKIISKNNFSREVALAKDFEIKLKNLKDPEGFLNNKVIEGKKSIEFIRGLRSLAIVIMIFIIGRRFIVNYRIKNKNTVK